MTKLSIIVGTIIIFLGLNTFLRKYGHRRITMESVWSYSKIAVLWLEHIAMVLVGVAAGWWINRRMSKKDVVQPILSREEIRSIVRAENLDSRTLENTYEKDLVEEQEVKEEVKAVSECPGWGKEFVAAIGQVWLEKNFGNPNYSNKNA